jgi:putative hydrolase of the HAD superfamily
LKAAFIELDEHGYRPRGELFAELDAKYPGRLRLDAEAFLTYWYEEFPTCAIPMPGLYDVLDGFAKRNIRMGLVTNGVSVLQRAKIDKLGIRTYMSAIVISEEAGIRKPDPAIFRLALARMGADAGAALFVGDNPIADMPGARAAGLISVWLGRGQEWPVVSFQPDRIITELADLLNLR